MLRTECEDLLGFRLAFGDYEKIIEPMYNALPDQIEDQETGELKTLTKREFIRMLNPAYFHRRSRECLKRMEGPTK